VNPVGLVNKPARSPYRRISVSETDVPVRRLALDRHCEEKSHFGTRSVHQTHYCKDESTRKPLVIRICLPLTSPLGRKRAWIVPEDAGPADQPLDELKPEMRPQDPHGDGRDWKFEGWTFATENTAATNPTTCHNRSRIQSAGTLGGLRPAEPRRQNRHSATSPGGRYGRSERGADQ
jgi:hypothetical protein